MELFEQIRRAFYINNESKRSIAKRYKIHKRTVHQALESAIPPKRAKNASKEILLTEAMKLQIDKWLVADKSAPRKQRHTSKRIFQRLGTELNYLGAEPSIRKFVGQRRRVLGINKNAFVPLVHLPGEEAEVDWYEAKVDFGSGPEKAQVFLMRACHSGKEFHMAFPRQTQQAFFEGHIAAFNFFGGVFPKIRYDNLTSAVKKVLRGRKRIENETFILFRSHYLFEAAFCQPGKEGAHEKGGVEGGVGRFRRQYFVPVPETKSYKLFNEYLLGSCHETNKRTIIGKSQSIAEDWENEINKLLNLPKKHFDTDIVKVLQVNAKSLIKDGTNYYSVPTSLVGLKVEVRLSTIYVHAYTQGKQVAAHTRRYKNNTVTADLDHYLELLWQKPGAFSNSLPLKQAKDNHQWPKCYELLHQALITKHGHYTGTQQMIEVLMLNREFPLHEVLASVQWAEQSGFISAEAVVYFIHEHRGKFDSADTFTAYEHLKGFGYTDSQVTHYNELISTTENHHEH